MTRRFLAALTIALFSGCATEESQGFLQVNNDTDQALAVFAFPEGTLIDPIPYLPPGSFEENMIAPGRRLGFNEVPGYQPGHGVFLIVYVVQRQGAEIAMSVTVTGAQLTFFHGHVSIDALPTPRA